MESLFFYTNIHPSTFIFRSSTGFIRNIMGQNLLEEAARSQPTAFAPLASALNHLEVPDNQGAVSRLSIGSKLSSRSFNLRGMAALDKNMC